MKKIRVCLKNIYLCVEPQGFSLTVLHPLKQQSNNLGPKHQHSYSHNLQRDQKQVMDSSWRQESSNMQMFFEILKTPKCGLPTSHQHPILFKSFMPNSSFHCWLKLVLLNRQRTARHGHSCPSYQKTFEKKKKDPNISFTALLSVHIFCSVFSNFSCNTLAGYKNIYIE